MRCREAVFVRIWIEICYLKSVTQLTLAEGVAQLAAIAPYTAGSGRPVPVNKQI